MNQFVISVMSRDRVGIVHEVASRISALQGNIADLSQTVLRGYFTMILLAAFPETTTVDTIQQQLAPLEQADEFPLKVSVLPITDQAIVATQPSPENIYVLTARGADRIGFVATVAAFCTEQGINILDLATVAHGDEYTMMLQVDLSGATSLSTIQRSLRQFGERHSIQLVLQHNDIFQAIHEINMPR
jgi:glycine cleavage system transcriptional repressor